MEWMIMPLKRYADFSGRSRRKEYWMFQLLNILVMIPLTILMFVGGAGGSEIGSGGLGAVGFLGLGLIILYFLIILIPSIAVQVRRFHDQDKSGWLILLGFIPYIGSIIVFVFMCFEGTRGENRFGPDPKGYGGDVRSVFE